MQRVRFRLRIIGEICRKQNNINNNDKNDFAIQEYVQESKNHRNTSILPTPLSSLTQTTFSTKKKKNLHLHRCTHQDLLRIERLSIPATTIVPLSMAQGNKINNNIYKEHNLVALICLVSLLRLHRDILSYTKKKLSKNAG